MQTPAPPVDRAGKRMCLVPNATEQPTDRSRRGTLVILFVVAAIGVGLWFALERPKLAEPAGDARTVESDTTSPTGDARTADSGAASMAGDARTADSGAVSTAGDARTADSGAASTAGDARTADSGAASTAGDAQTTVSGAASTAGDAQTADSGAASTAGDAQTADSGAASTAGDAQTADSGAASTAGDAQTADSGAASTAGDAQTADSGAASTAGDAQTADSGAVSTAGDAQTADSGAASTAGDLRTAAASQEPDRPADPDTTGDATRIAAVEPGATPVGEAPRTAPAPESTIEKAPVDAPPDAEATGEAGVLAAVGRAIERIETAIEERLDSELEVQVTYDDSQGDAPQAEVAPTEATRTAESDTTLPAGGAPIPDSDVGADTSIAGSVGSGGAAPSDATMAPESTIEKAPVDAPPDAEATGEAGVLAAVGRAIERIETAIEERLDSELEVQVTYDDSQGDAPQAEVAPTEATRTAESDTTLPAGGAPIPDSDVGADTSIAGSVGSGGAAPSDATMAPESTIEKAPVDAPPDAEATGEAGVLAAVGRAIERIETAIEERLDSELEVQVTYDDSQGDAPQAEVAPTEATRTAESDTTLPAGGAPIPDSDVGADTSIAGSVGSGGAAPSDATMAPESTTTAATGSAEAEAEAKEYVETLTATAPQTIPVDKADHFVTPERVISLVPEDTIESVSVDRLAGDESLSADTPITVVREVEQVENAVAEQLIADAGGNLDKVLRVQVTYEDSQDESGPRVVEEGDVERITVREALERIRTEPDKPLPVIRTVRYFDVMTLKELLDGAADEDAFLSVVTQPYRIESATLADLLQRQQAENPDSIFYLHTVLPTDVQGIWGIVHFGIIDNFARGMAFRRGEDIETYTVRIPRHADERLADRSSSFLGLMIDRKTKDSYVYNFRDSRMGRNPDRIFPGQELVIINFQPEELRAIYRHFAAS